MQGDAEVERPVDGADRLGVAACPGVDAGHAHGAQTDARDVESANVVCFMVVRSGQTVSDATVSSLSPPNGLPDQSGLLHKTTFRPQE